MHKSSFEFPPAYLNLLHYYLIVRRGSREGLCWEICQATQPYSTLFTGNVNLILDSQLLLQLHEQGFPKFVANEENLGKRFGRYHQI